MVDVVENKYLQSDDQPIVLYKELSEHHVVGEQPLVTSIPATIPTSTKGFGPLSYEDAIVALEEQLHDNYEEEGGYVSGDLIKSKFDHMLGIE